MSDVSMQRAAKPMGLTVKWDASEVTDASKHVFLGSVVKGVLVAREEFMDATRAANGKGPAIIYKIRMDDGSFVSVWETAMIRDAMEEGNNGGQVPIGAIVEFQHKGKKQGKNKSQRPYHVVEVLFGIPSPAMQRAGGVSGAQSATPAAPQPTQPQAPANSNATGGW